MRIQASADMTRTAVAVTTRTQWIMDEGRDKYRNVNPE
jgi:hypothetical protein